MIESLKPLYNKLLRPTARLFLKIGLHPNHVTVLGLLCFIASGVLGALYHWYWAFLMGFLGSCMDGLDGLLARESGKKTVFGAIFDSSCDRLTEMAIIGGVLWYYLQADPHCWHGPALCYGALCSSVMVSYVKARCEGMGVSCSRGVLQRPERMILIGIGLLGGPSVMLWMLGAIVLLGAYTVIERLIQATAGDRKTPHQVFRHKRQLKK